MSLHEVKRVKREFIVKVADVKQAMTLNMKPSNDLKEQQGIFPEDFERI